MESPLVHALSLGRRYEAGGTQVAALNGIDFHIQRGEFVALVGPSGSGKSTLLNLIGGLDVPTDGEVWVDGLSVGAASDKQLVQYRRQRVGFIFQSFNLLPSLTAAENVEQPMILAELPRGERKKRAVELLGSVGLSERAQHRPTELSGGEKQRVAIARALANQPILLLADEPTGNLDSHTGTTVLNLLCELLRTRKITMVLVTHDMQVAARADRTIHLRDGLIEQLP